MDKTSQNVYFFTFSRDGVTQSHQKTARSRSPYNKQIELQNQKCKKCKFANSSCT